MEHLSAREKGTGSSVMKKHHGFSILELVIVLAIAMIVSAIAIPAVEKVTDTYRLNSSGTAVATVLQQARMAAVKANQPYYVQLAALGGCGAANAANANMVCAVPASRFVPLTYDPTVDPTEVIASNVTFQAAPPPSAANLTLLIGGVPQVGGVIGFNARGMPCVSPAGNPFICTTNAAFEWFMQSASSQAWEAVTVTSAGRIRSWRSDFNSQNWE